MQKFNKTGYLVKYSHRFVFESAINSVKENRPMG